MSYLAVADESHIHSKSAPCYGIGCLLFQADAVQDLSQEISAIFASHGVDYEIKWNKIRDYRPVVEACIDGIVAVLRDGATFHSMVVEKSTYLKWQKNKEEAFYTTYYHLAKHVVSHTGGPVSLNIDSRSDHYPRQAEVLKIVTNRALLGIASLAEVTGVTMVDSKRDPTLQLVDVILGAITADTNRLLTGLELNEGKKEVIRRIANMLGWERLCFDTYPNNEFNIWHFPVEFRGRPFPTRSVSLQEALTF